MKTFTTITNPEFYDLIVADAKEHETDWTISRHARPGDRVLLYVTAPISCVVAQAFVISEPRLEEDPASEFVGSYFADMDGLEMLTHPIARETLRKCFPDWGYWKQPRNSVEVPEEYLNHLDLLIR